MHRRWIQLVALLALGSAGLAHAFPPADGASRADPYPKVVREVFSHIEKKYVEPGRATARGVLKGAFKALETQYPQVMVNVDDDKNEAIVRVDEAEKRFELRPGGKVSSAAEPLNGVLSFVAAQLKESFERDDLYYAALNGALSALDPHSNAFSPKSFKEFMIGTRGTFGGIGFVFGIRDGDMTIITPIDGTPADRAGLKTGDKILYIDGEPTINMPVDVAADKMRGEPNTQVTLTLSREGWPEPRPFTFTREMIRVDSVETYVLPGADAGPVLYAKVKNFQKDTTEDLRASVKDAEARHPNLTGLILDLRNDPGGLLDQAIEVADGFMDKGTIVSTRGPDEENNSRASAKGDTPISKKPVILLVNQGSASASEIVAGALKASRALLVGQKTFGKGSVQKVLPLSDGGALKLTVAQYLTPGDISIQSIGVQPDIATYPTVIGKKTRLGPPPSHMEEATLENAFKEWGNASEKPWREIQYQQPPEPEDEEKVKTFAELPKAEKLAKLKADFEVRLAQRILARTATGDLPHARDHLFKAAGGVLEEARKEEDAKIGKILADQGIDWTDGKDEGKHKLTIRVPRELRLEGGTTAEIPVTVRNDGTRTVYHLWGRTDSSNPLLKNLDFIFGRIEPGKEKTWTAKVEVPKSAVDRWDTVTLSVRAGLSKEIASSQGSAHTVAIPAPRYSYSYELKDENPADRAKSGDGVLEEGERATLHLSVRNRGSAASPPLDVNIRGETKEQIYLEAARKKLDGLASGERKDAPMAFRLVKATEDKKADIVVNISNREFAIFFSDTLKFPVGKPYTAKGVRSPPELTLAKQPPLRTTAARVSLEVKASDDDLVKDAYAYLGEKKIFYSRNRTGGGAFSARFEVPLEAGSNRLTLFVRDQEDLLTTR
ncbi:MAG: PDZ domain-containing protein, partial [Deltaproteobacteria bacterium]|nr:PDZ domain-containing protein [Deltaproteobacteria bacterium]